jgi:predicted outer membrane protein
LGGERGAGEQVRSLGPEVEQLGRSADQQIRAAATAQGIELSDQLDAATQATVTGLEAQSGQAFDGAWLSAVEQTQQQTRDAAAAVLDDPNASAEAKAAAQELLAQLEAGLVKVRAAGVAGAGTPGTEPGNATREPGETPRSVNAGTGGHAASDGGVLAPLAVIAIGVVLLGGAGFLLRRSRRT